MSAENKFALATALLGSKMSEELAELLSVLAMSNMTSPHAADIVHKLRVLLGHIVSAPGTPVEWYLSGVTASTFPTEENSEEMVGAAAAATPAPRRVFLARRTPTGEASAPAATAAPAPVAAAAAPAPAAAAAAPAAAAAAPAAAAAAPAAAAAAAPEPEILVIEDLPLPNREPSTGSIPICSMTPDMKEPMKAILKEMRKMAKTTDTVARRALASRTRDDATIQKMIDAWILSENKHGELQVYVPQNVINYFYRCIVKMAKLRGCRVVHVHDLSLYTHRSPALKEFNLRELVAAVKTHENAGKLGFDALEHMILVEPTEQEWSMNAREFKQYVQGLDNELLGKIRRHVQMNDVTSPAMLNALSTLYTVMREKCRGANDWLTSDISSTLGFKNFHCRNMGFSGLYQLLTHLSDYSYVEIKEKEGVRYFKFLEEAWRQLSA